MWGLDPRERGIDATQSGNALPTQTRRASAAREVATPCASAAEVATPCASAAEVAILGQNRAKSVLSLIHI